MGVTFLFPGNKKFSLKTRKRTHAVTTGAKFTDSQLGAKILKQGPCAAPASCNPRVEKDKIKCRGFKGSHCKPYKIYTEGLEL